MSAQESKFGARFAEIFKGQVWAKIPPVHRAGMAGHWAKDRRTRVKDFVHETLTEVKQVYLKLAAGRPLVELLADTRFYRYAGLPGQAPDVAHCTAGGRILRFNSWLVEQMPKFAVAAVIAHELAHVLQDARGKKYNLYQWEEKEQDANATLSEWGFRLSDTLHWFAKHRQALNRRVRDIQDYWKQVQDTRKDLPGVCPSCDRRGGVRCRYETGPPGHPPTLRLNCRSCGRSWDAETEG